MNTKDFYYNLPESQIAQIPATPRDSSRLLVYHRKTESLERKHFYDIIDYLNAGDVLVVNNTRVIPARLFGTIESGKVVELLLLRRLDYNHYEAICKPAKKLKVGVTIDICGKLKCFVESIQEQGVRTIRLDFEGVLENILDEVGQTPLPPYITAQLDDKERYQTVYSKVQGSAAAPTAGLHFTEELLEKIEKKGVIIAKVLLHVGLSTFRPVKVDNVENHVMHTEYFEVTQETADKINSARAKGGRIVCVGTTSVRTLESVSDESGVVHPRSGLTSIFIYPPYKMKACDALITNFHLPESTLIMLVASMCSRERILDVYNTAVSEQYRFFSFGDAMYIE